MMNHLHLRMKEKETLIGKIAVSFFYIPFFAEYVQKTLLNISIKGMFVFIRRIKEIEWEYFD